MARKKLIVITTSFFAVFLCITPAYATQQTRDIITIQRLESVFTERYCPGSPDVATESTYMINFYYNLDIPDLIDSTVIRTTSMAIDMGDTLYVLSDTTNVHYTGNIVYENGMRHINYTTDTGLTISFIRDSQYRIRERIAIGQGGYHKHYIWYYGVNDRVDSIYYFVGQQEPSRYIYHYQNNNNSPPTSVSLYMYQQEFGNWVYVNSYPYTYPVNYPQNEVMLNLDDVIAIMDFNFYLRLVVHPLYQNSSYGSGYDCYSLSYSPFGDGVQVNINEDTYLRFNSDGFLTYFFEDNEYGITRTTFTWQPVEITGNVVEQPHKPFMVFTYPNPFHQTINLDIQKETSEPIDVRIYNIKGQCIYTCKTLKTNHFSWDGKDDNNRQVGSGVYFARVECAGKTCVAKMLLLK